MLPTTPIPYKTADAFLLPYRRQDQSGSSDLSLLSLYSAPTNSGIAYLRLRTLYDMPA